MRLYAGFRGAQPDMPEREKNEDSPVQILTRRKRWLIAALLIVAGLIHAIVPRWFALDWPSIALVLGGVLLIFVPMEDIGAILESLEFGKTKLLFRSAKQLDKSVEAAKAEQSARATYNLQASAAPGADDKIEALLSTDKEMALIRIGIEMERLLLELYRSSGAEIQPRLRIWPKILEELEIKGVIAPATAKACKEFQIVRNRLVHPTSERVPEAVVGSAVDSGIKLIRVLSSLTPGS